jgi:hypothetical protein
LTLADLFDELDCLEELDDDDDELEEDDDEEEDDDDDDDDDNEFEDDDDDESSLLSLLDAVLVTFLALSILILQKQLLECIQPVTL